MTDLRTLGKAMRDALQYLVEECDPDMDDDYNPHAAPLRGAREAIAAFDKALSEPPAALAEIEGLVKRLQSAGWFQGGSDFARELATALETLSARVGELERMDREAATHVESVICLRSKHFTGEPPYVGWNGLGLALTQDYDRAERLEAALRPFAEIAEHDIGEDEADTDFYRPMMAHNRAPRLTVGDFRRARTALSTEAKTLFCKSTTKESLAGDRDPSNPGRDDAP